MPQPEKEPTGAGLGKSVCHFSCQSARSACRAAAADSDLGLEWEWESGLDEGDEADEAEVLAGGWAAVPFPDELQAPTASAAATSKPSLVIRLLHPQLSGTRRPLWPRWPLQCNYS